MRTTDDARRIRIMPGFGWAMLAAVPLALAVSCGDATPSYVVPPGGSGGSGASAGAGGSAGDGAGGGTAGNGGTGTGGNGTGGVSGTGGGGTGGGGNSAGACATNALCHSCPSDVLADGFLCNTDDDCELAGYVCVPSGCRTHGGAPIGQCQAPAGGSCTVNGDCPAGGNHVCATVGLGGKQCVRDGAGCSPATESYDCAPGFSCEGGSCVDRRVPCDNTTDCPKSHICHLGIPTASFCVRVYRTCHVDDDCRWEGGRFGASCADVDNYGPKECTGDLDGSACVNSTSCSGDAPVCENGVFGTGLDAVCGEYGLCRTDDDCGGAFICADLWQDGRKECVESPGDCDSATDCSTQQVCAAPRDGGSPSCQAGKKEAT